MSNVYTSADQLIGRTPLLELTHIEKAEGLKAHIYGKLEYFNPAGSVKDRIAKAMIDDAEAKGVLKAGSVIIEPTSGNTGIGLASVAAARLPYHYRNAGNHERRAQTADEGIRRRACPDRRCKGHEGCNRKGRRAGKGNS